MQRLQWFSTLPRRRLFWVAVGAFASAAAMLLAQALIVAARPKSEVLIIRARYDNIDTMTQVIAAVGNCLGKFNVENYAHAYTVQIPTENLRRDDYECLLRAGPIGENARGSTSLHGEDWQGVDWQISSSS